MKWGLLITCEIYKNYFNIMHKYPDLFSTIFQLYQIKLFQHPSPWHRITSNAPCLSVKYVSSSKMSFLKYYMP